MSVTPSLLAARVEQGNDADVQTIQLSVTCFFAGTPPADTGVTGCPTITITDSLPDGIEGQSYTGSVSGGGGVAPYTYSVISGALPTGLTLNASTGDVSGTPTVLGTFNFTIRALDDRGCWGDLAISVKVCPLITLDDTLPDAINGTAYTGAVIASGGSGSTTYAVTSGSLPTGLTLASNGTLSGTPSASGTFNFTVTATDSNGCTGSRAYTVVTNDAVPGSCPGGLGNYTLTGGPVTVADNGDAMTRNMPIIILTRHEHLLGNSF